ncbi:unnamed protein product, partial [Musa hybrid cultivar]
MYREGAASSESLVEYSYGKVEGGGVEDRGGGEQDPAGDLVGRVASVGLTGAEDADGSGDSYDVNERRFSAAGRDAGSGGRWDVGEASPGNVAAVVVIA